MQPNHCLLGQVREPRAASRMTCDGHQPLRDNGQPQPSGAAPMRSEDSWIDVSSQPSSSSVSSAATNEDIITTGLRVEHGEAGAYQRRNRRRRIQHLAAITTAQADYASRDASQASSSQEEYDESESESDQVLSSSNEDINRPALPTGLSARSAPLSSSSIATSSDDEDDTSTALGMGISPSPFVPQPNIFTHPPATSEPGWAPRRTQPSVPSTSTHRAHRRDSYPSLRSSRRTQHQHSPYNMFSPSHHADHDAALRASLSTLLSCAAAARGLPKNDNRQPSTSAAPTVGAQPALFRLVGPSVAMGEESSDEEAPSSPRYPETSPSTGGPERHLRVPEVSSDPVVAKAKRRSSSPKDRSVTSKKNRRMTMSDSTTTVSPTIMTWVISAGVVVLFSAISFSAGYMIGREVGRVEVGMMGDGVPGPRPSTGCGQEAVRGGLRKLRWGSAAAGSASLASM
ncbi:uncharacterized protein N7479_000454 [Penicillium vulpinum]|uniref:REJ domain-containing protein n=1 Tax=Penicillium vulpinum TaxID=29845 RepID=A0A1V6S667_9EURO|nr:uncharacterized protein N7479_000454 [Penicillium vulpinum]KAJ5970536.1 hypothetical protein N7479_000454 [Penicillium vulpinum]OQE09220.1 hypothetical protein PENVUL_c007G00418 [Penicillium vulpinum]